MFSDRIIESPAWPKLLKLVSESQEQHDEENLILFLVLRVLSKSKGE